MIEVMSIKRGSDVRFGFTLVELLIVIVVVAVLAAITTMAYSGVQNRANDSVIQSDLRQSYSKIMQFRAVNDRWPTAQSEINDTFAATRKSNGGGANTYLYCYSDTDAALVMRSVSTNGYYYSTNQGLRAIATWPGDSNGNLCPAAGIPPTSSGYQFVWIRANGSWQAWFTPGL